MNEDTLAKMTPGTMFINVTRGGLVDETALVNALKSGIWSLQHWMLRRKNRYRWIVLCVALLI